MILSATFVFTASICILVLIKFLSIMVGNSISMPHFGILSPTTFIFMYPSILFQVWFWAEKLGVVA